MNSYKRELFGIAAVVLLLISSFANAGVLKSTETLSLSGGESVSLTWLKLDNTQSPPRALVVLQHGMMRKAENMFALANVLLEKNLQVVLPTVKDSQVLNAEFPELFSIAFQEKRTDPQGQTLPSKVIMAGFSAGARFLNHVAYFLRERNFDIRGVLLLDPVVSEQAGQQFGPRLPVSYFTILGKPQRCNAHGNSYPILTSGRFQTQGFRLKTASHCDFEGQSSDSLCYLYCGSSSKQNIAAIQLFASEWISGLVDSDKPDADFLPGGKVFAEWEAKGLFDTVFK